MSEADAAIPELAAKAARRWRPGWRGTLRMGLLILLLPILSPIAAGLLMLGHEVTAPSWIRESVEARAAAVLNGGDLQFGEITVLVGADLHPRIRLTNAVLRDADDVVLARVPQIEAQLSPRGLLFNREVLPQVVTLTGAELGIRRMRDGRVAMAFDRSADAAPLREATGFVGLLEEFDQVFERPALAALEGLRIEGLVVNFEDERAGRGWTVDGGNLALDLRDGQTRLTGDMSLLSGRSYVTRVTLNYQSPRGSPAAQIGMTITDAAATDIATQSPALSWLSVLQAQISASFRITIDQQGNFGPLSAALKIGAGALAPTAGARPIAFDTARAYLAFDPGSGAIRFDQVTVKSEWGALQAEGQAYLREMQGGLPGALLAQFSLTELSLNPRGLYAEALQFPEAYADFRLRLNPFEVSFANITVVDPTVEGDPESGGRLTARADISAAPEGWTVSADMEIDAMTRDRGMQVWPESYLPLSRIWFADNLTRGNMFNFNAAFRLRPGQEATLASTYEFSDLTVRPVPGHNPITGGSGHAIYQDNGFTVVLDEGQIAAPQGGDVDLAGSVLIIPDNRLPTPPATVRLQADSTITAALSILDQPPLRILANAGMPVDLADGRALTSGDINLPLGAPMGPGVVDFDLTARLTDVRSAVLVPGRVLAASALTVTATPSEVAIAGPMTIGRVPAEVVWRQPLSEAGGAGGDAVVEAEVELSERFIDEFEIGLPSGMVSGAGTGNLRMTLPQDGGDPAFEMTSDLRGLTLRLPAVAYTKGADRAGTFTIAGELGDVPRIDRITLDAAGLTATGNLTISAAGLLERARFDRVTLGNWFDAPVVLVGRGADRTVGVEIGGGTLDFRTATFGDSDEEGGPLTVALDRVQITDGIALTDFRATLDATGVVQGNFTATINGGPPVRGSLVPEGGESAVHLVADDAGAVLRAAGYFDTGERGALQLVLVPTGAPGTYDGTARISAITVRDAPALASLLNAVSVFGLLQQLSGQGLVFDDVRADFRIDPTALTVTRASAVGVGLGISLDGRYLIDSDVVDFQGVLSPFYVLNAVGSVLTRRGEGLIGFNFNLGGTYADWNLTVNPFSVLTPGMFREIFRRPAPELE